MPVPATLPRSVRRPLRTALSGLLAVALTGLIAAPVFAQKTTVKPPATQTLRAEGDGYPINITYYEANKDQNASGLENAPVAILLHGEGGSRLIWDKSSAPKTDKGKPFAQVLNDLGYAVVTVDLRKHGESLADGQARALDNNDFFRMAHGDLPAVKKFLVAEHEAKKLNINKLAIVASDSMAPVALEFAELDWRQPPYPDGPGGSAGTPRGQDVHALVLVSPVLSVGKVNANRSANYLKSRPIAFAIIAGTKDVDDKGSAAKIHQIVASIRQNQERIEFIRPELNLRGTDMFGTQARIEPSILTFLDKNVKDLTTPWATRVSRYERDTPKE
jgi:pimeloyl-ACP methyl ester carboxylesterase